MKYSWINDYCLTQLGTVKEFKEKWNATLYKVGNKMFALLGNDKANRPIITLKLQQDEGDFLRQKYSDIVSGYYMNKIHWNSVYLDGFMPDDIIKDMISKSYSIIFTSLTKKVRYELIM
jgi:predicted DNA-binding protein (MmcQ/YjbR family)